MMQFKQLKPHELNEAAQFIARLNKVKSHHIGYCGTEYDNILADLMSDFMTDDSTSICALYEKEEIIGLIGLDIDDSTAEIWGPFHTHQDFSLQMELWQFMTSQFPEVSTFLFFIVAENMMQQQFLERLNATKTGEHSYFFLERNQEIDTSSESSRPYVSEDFAEFEAIHSSAFPKTYYDAETVVKRSGQANNELIVFKTDDHMQGYGYFEKNPEEGSAHLEYIGIAEQFRGQGLGKRLLKDLLAIIFSDDQIHQVTLTVNLDNQEANPLYEAVGFHKRDELWSYRLVEDAK